MAIAPQVLFDESKCYLCDGISQWDAIELGLLSLKAAASGGGSGSGVWGSITGTLSNQADLQAALNAKTDLYTLTFYNSGFNTMNSGNTYFLGQNGTGDNGVQLSYTNVRVVIPVAGTVVAVTVNQFTETNVPTGENLTLSLNKNNGTITALGVISLPTPSSTLFSPLAVVVAQGDFLALQIVCPVFGTSPLNSRWTATIVIQKT